MENKEHEQANVDRHLHEREGEGREYLEETAAEVAVPRTIVEDRERNFEESSGAGTGVGVIALILSILSLFVLPVLFSIGGIVIGFIARRGQAQTLGSWAIGIGVVSLFVTMFVRPFF